MYDIFFVSNNFSKSIKSLEKIKNRFSMIKKASSLEEAISKSVTKFCWIIWDDIDVSDSFDFSYKPDDGSQTYIHVFKNGNSYDGICLIPKNAQISKREIEYRFFISKKEVDILASTSKPYDVFIIDSYDEYLKALEKTTTSMFWMTSRNIKILDDFNLDFRVSDMHDKTENHVFIHRVGDKDLYNGLFLCSTKKILTKKEIDYRFPVSRKEWDIVATIPVVYDAFTIDSYEEYLEALATTKTEMFWMIPKEIEVNKTFNFSDYYFEHSNLYDRTIHHSFKNIFIDTENYEGIFLLSDKKQLSKREVEYRFLLERKEHDIIASKNSLYDIIFISYNEHNADENYEKLKFRFPKVKRIHGVN